MRGPESIAGIGARQLCDAPMSYDDFLLSTKNIKTEKEHLLVL